MTSTKPDHPIAHPEPVRLSRLINAPRETVFKAWSSAEHVKHWFCPTVYTIPEARVEMHVGGAFDVCMRSPDGVEHWTRGRFLEVSPVDRLVIDMQVAGTDGIRLFRALTEVNFGLAPGGTRLDIVQTYTFDQPEMAAPMVKGASIGWSQTLDKLEAQVARIFAESAVVRSVVHGMFTIERSYDAPVDRVYRALSDMEAKSKWFGAPADQCTVVERHMDFRIGGTERLKGRWTSGMISTFDATYHDIIPNQRIVYTYEMHLDDRKISVSLATVQLTTLTPGSTRLKVTEQGAFLDGYDDGGSREHGTGFLLEQLGATL